MRAKIPVTPVLTASAATAVALGEGSMSGCPFRNFSLPMLSVKGRENKDGIFKTGILWARSKLPLGISTAAHDWLAGARSPSVRVD